jgi:hypothetical protein
MTSETRIAYGSRVARNGRLRPCSSYQPRIAACRSFGAEAGVTVASLTSAVSGRRIVAVGSTWPPGPQPADAGNGEDAAVWIGQILP